MFNETVKEGFMMFGVMFMTAIFFDSVTPLDMFNSHGKIYYVVFLFFYIAVRYLAKVNTAKNKK
ncbi:hypothetical protein ACOYYW_11670 [Enterococcus lactis]|uniref:hypothetical protein n=1 Tax=Enterococcus lactis TaxID=357441 RepID=UPI003BD67A9A